MLSPQVRLLAACATPLLLAAPAVAGSNSYGIAGAFDAASVSRGMLARAPELESWALLVTGIGLLAAARRRRRTIPVVVA